MHVPAPVRGGRDRRPSPILVVAVAALAVVVVAASFYLVRRESAGSVPPSCAADFSACRANLTASGANFEVIDWPTILLGVAFSNASFDPPFLSQVHRLGIRTLAIETDPSFFSAYPARFSSLLAEARGLGLKVHLINQLGYRSWYDLVGLTYPFAPDPSFATFESFEVNATRAYAQVHPDLLSIIAEPGLMMEKIGASYSASEWSSLLATLGSTAKAISPSTETWVDLVPQDPFDAGLVSALGGISDLDGIGLDLYGSVAPPSVTTRMAQTIHDFGKLGGLTETWAYDLYGDPATDVPSNLPAETAWLSPTGIVNYAVTYDLTGAFDPFFTGFFTSTAPLGNFTVAGLTEEARTYYAELSTNQTTPLYTAYQTTISESA